VAALRAPAHGKGEADPLSRMLGSVFSVLENKYWVDEADF
jgi:hypothetical protein